MQSQALKEAVRVKRAGRHRRRFERVLRPELETAVREAEEARKQAEGGEAGEEESDDGELNPALFDDEGVPVPDRMKQRKPVTWLIKTIREILDAKFVGEGGGDTRRRRSRDSHRL